MKKFLESLKIRVIPGIGKKTEERFNEMFMETIKDLKKIDVFTLNKEFGRKNGTYIYNAIRGVDNELVKEKEDSTQYSKMTTLKKDSKNHEFLLENLEELCKQVHHVIIKNNILSSEKNKYVGFCQKRRCLNQLEYISYNQI